MRHRDAIIDAKLRRKSPACAAQRRMYFVFKDHERLHGGIVLGVENRPHRQPNPDAAQNPVRQSSRLIIYDFP